jgi:hypothetical protein
VFSLTNVNKGNGKDGTIGMYIQNGTGDTASQLMSTSLSIMNSWSIGLTLGGQVSNKPNSATATGQLDAGYSWVCE